MLRIIENYYHNIQEVTSQQQLLGTGIICVFPEVYCVFVEVCILRFYALKSHSFCQFYHIRL